MYSVAGKASGVGSATLPCVSLYAPAGNGGVIRELAVWNTTATACVYKWQKLTTAGTVGAGLTEVEWEDASAAPTMTGFDAHSVAPTLTGVVEFMPIGAAIGAGYYFTYGGRGLVIPAGTANGVGLILAEGTGQILAYKIVWEE